MHKHTLGVLDRSRASQISHMNVKYVLTSHLDPHVGEGHISYGVHRQWKLPMFSMVCVFEHDLVHFSVSSIGFSGVAFDTALNTLLKMPKPHV